MLEAGSRIDRGARLNLIGLFLLSFAVGAAADTLQADMDAVLKADARNAGVVVHVHRAAADVLVYDLISVAPTNSMADVFRVLLQFAHTEQAREFKTVQLSLRGAPRFLISGSYFRQLGQEFGAQNPVYTIRMFPESLTKMDGSRAYPSWSGGLIGVVGKQMQDANDFQRRWWMNDLFPAGKSAYPENTGVSQASAPLTAQSVAAAPAPAKPTPPSNPVVEVPEAERGRPVEPAAARGPMPIPAWFATFPGARGLEKTTSPGEADISYNAPASPAEVVGFYRERFRSSRCPDRSELQRHRHDGPCIDGDGDVRHSDRRGECGHERKCKVRTDARRASCCNRAEADGNWNRVFLRGSPADRLRTTAAAPSTVPAFTRHPSRRIHNNWLCPDCQPHISKCERWDGAKRSLLACHAEFQRGRWFVRLSFSTKQKRSRRRPRCDHRRWPAPSRSYVIDAARNRDRQR